MLVMTRTLLESTHAHGPTMTECMERVFCTGAMESARRIVHITMNLTFLGA